MWGLNVIGGLAGMFINVVVGGVIFFGLLNVAASEVGSYLMIGVVAFAMYKLYTWFMSGYES